MRRVIRIVFLTSLFVLVAYSKDRRPPQGKFVDVGGYRLYFRVLDGRAPTVLLEAGGGLDSSSWDAVQEPVAQATGSRVISYDRAGWGSSDAATYGRYDIVKEVTALHRGFEKLGATDELILVGMSYGAFLAQVYTSHYPGHVKGIVLVEPNNLAFNDAVGDVIGNFQRWKR